MTENVLEQLHFLEVLKEAAQYNQKVAFNNLQTARTEFDRVHECQEIETWKGVLVMLEQREHLIKNIKLLLLESRVPEDVALAVKENLKDLGVSL